MTHEARPALFQHQREALGFLRARARSANLSEYGTGKTAPACAWLAELVPPHRALVVCTSAKVDDWVAALRAFGRDWWRISVMGGDRVTRRAQRWRALRAEHHVGVLNFEGLLIFGKALRPLYDVLVVDELHRAKNPCSLISRSLAALGDSCSYVHGITGSPVLENFLELAAVYRVINPDVFGRRMKTFRETWFRKVSSYVCPTCRHELTREAPWCEKCQARGARTYPKWRPIEGATELLTAAVHSSAFYRTKDQVPVSWPLVVPAPRITAPLDPKVRRMADALERQVSVLLCGGASVSGKEVRPRLQKLMQLAQGWVYAPGRRPILVAPRCPKVRRFEEHLEEVRGRNRQLVVWAVYPPDFELVGRALTRQGLTYACVQGSTPRRARPEIQMEFNAGARQVLVAHPTCLGEGVDLAADYGSYFSRTWSHLQFDQSQGRVVRMLQRTKRVVLTQFTSEGVDDSVVDALEGKRSFLKDVHRVRGIPQHEARRDLVEAMGA